MDTRVFPSNSCRSLALAKRPACALPFIHLRPCGTSLEMDCPHSKRRLIILELLAMDKWYTSLDERTLWKGLPARVSLKLIRNNWSTTKSNRPLEPLVFWGFYPHLWDTPKLFAYLISSHHSYFMVSPWHLIIEPTSILVIKKLDRLENGHFPAYMDT